MANEDWDMWLRVARHSRFLFVDAVVARIRWHPGNLTGLGSQHLDAVLASRTIPLDKTFAAPDLPPQVAAMRAVAYSNVHLFRGLRWWQAGRRRAAVKEFRHVVRLSHRPTVSILRITWRAALQPVLERSRPGRALTGYVATLYKRVGP